ncbi:MAG: hypothetical protein KatS3mg031_1762 [Chitinophagales bacterium]|nr:MAG: hypothetical protein KatS3mg031_1762 [Chitinophagales bacterium]
MFKYTATTLKKIEEVFSQAGYIIRYEKGNFKPGYCILQDKKVVVINRYFETEARINTLLEILPQLEIDENLLSEEARAFFEKNLQKA